MISGIARHFGVADHLCINGCSLRATSLTQHLVLFIPNGSDLIADHIGWRFHYCQCQRAQLSQ